MDPPYTTAKTSSTQCWCHRWLKTKGSSLNSLSVHSWTLAPAVDPPSPARNARGVRSLGVRGALDIHRDRTVGYNVTGSLALIDRQAHIRNPPPKSNISMYEYGPMPSGLAGRRAYGIQVRRDAAGREPSELGIACIHRRMYVRGGKASILLLPWH